MLSLRRGRTVLCVYMSVCEQRGPVTHWHVWEYFSQIAELRHAASVMLQASEKLQALGAIET